LLLNITDGDVKLGTILDNFKAFTAAFDPTLRGLTLGNSKEIRELHNSFAREHYMEVDMVS
jgi:ubiquitin carboxyl-terminal hydrolase L5